MPRERERPGYLPSVDGLRAVAVAMVVAYHAFPEWIPGGFVGVDVFFVISGFVITRASLGDVDAGRFEALRFYARRARRILPATFVTILACLACWLVLKPEIEGSALAGEGLSATLFYSNITFSRMAGYFDQNLRMSPLLHTWSLSVEEQFYILFPLLAWTLCRLGRKARLTTVSALLAGSLAMAVVGVARQEPSTYYLVQDRAWEILSGSLLALASVGGRPARPVGEAVAWAGLLILGALALSYNDAVPFPGLAALPPCLAAVAVIWSTRHPGTLAGRALSTAVARRVGRASFALYLVHWPVLVFTHLLVGVSAWHTSLVALPLTAALAIGLHLLVEVPVLGFRPSAGIASVLKVAGVAGIATVAASLVVVPVSASMDPAGAGSEDRVLAALAYDADGDYKAGTCFLTITHKDLSSFADRDCLSASTTKPNVLVLGDSHAAHLMHGYRARFPGVNFMQATSSGCRPTFPAVGMRYCTDLIQHVVDTFVDHRTLDAIVISARWRSEDVAGAVAMATRLKPHASRVVVSGPTVEYDQALPRILGAAARVRADPVTYAGRHRSIDQARTDKAFSAAPWPTGSRYASVYSALCRGSCQVLAHDGTPMAWDYGHLTAQGSDDLVALVGDDELGGILGHLDDDVTTADPR